VMALSQVLGVGTMALIAHASGRKDQRDANLIFNQSLSLALLCAILTLVCGYVLGDWYMGTLGADAATQLAGTTYIYWVMPGFGLQFALISMGSALRGTGIVKPTIIVQVVSVVLNAALCPIFISGWLTGRPLGVAGAGLATSLAVVVGVVLMFVYFHRLERFVFFDRSLMAPLAAAWKRILVIGLPPGGEFALMFVFMGVVYFCIRSFGAEAQAAYGIGSRVMHAIFLPAMAIAFATAPVAGQNMGAKKYDRVRATFKTSGIMLSCLMVLLTLVCQVRPEFLISIFTEESVVVVLGAEFLRIISLNFVPSGFVMVVSGMFQAMGNTLPSLGASASRFLTFVVPAVWLTYQPWFEVHHLWYVSVTSVTLQGFFAWYLLHREMHRKLPAAAYA